MKNSTTADYNKFEHKAIEIFKCTKTVMYFKKKITKIAVSFQNACWSSWSISFKSERWVMITVLQGIANEWGDYNCNVPTWTVQLLLENLAELQPHVLMQTGSVGF